MAFTSGGAWASGIGGGGGFGSPQHQAELEMRYRQQIMQQALNNIPPTPAPELHNNLLLLTEE